MPASAIASAPPVRSDGRARPSAIAPTVTNAGYVYSSSDTIETSSRPIAAKYRPDCRL